tara:strand:- start:93 stop:2099 length:2007 start_codon:yes stop_codon:yes gene_type:complete
MATKKVNIDIIAKDKTRMAMRTATAGVNNLKNSVFNLKVAFAGLGAGFVAKGFLDTAREIERLKIRFKFLFDEVAEGEKAFKSLIKFAGQVPFSLEEIQRGAANLAVVSKNAEEMNELLQITGDIAAATGLDFQTTSEQIQRVFSAGINSADLFRERGVREMLGFEAGVAISAEKSREHIITNFRNGTLAVQGASLEMAETFDGVMSMISDKFLQFKIELMDAGPFDFFKAAAILLEETVAKNFGSIEDAARHMGDRVVEGIKVIALGAASVVDAVTPAFNFLFGGINTLFRSINALPDFLKVAGIIGFLALGTKGKLVVVLITGVYNKIQEIFSTLLDFVIKSTDKIASAVKKLGFDETARQIEAFGDAIQKVKPDMVDGIEDIKESFEGNAIDLIKFLDVNDMEQTSGKFREMVEEIIRDIDMIMTNRLSENPVEPLEDGAKKASEELSKLEKAYQGFKTGFGDAMEEAGNIQKNFTNIGKQSFKELTDTLTNFVMTGKLQFEDLARTIIKQIINALIGAAVQSAVTKATEMFKMQAIKSALISVYEGALKTFAKIPFPFNIAAVGGAIAFGMNMVNKIRGFEKGGRPPVGQPSIVGEKGPELFVPDSAGTVVPNNQLGMEKSVTVNFNINTVDARGFNELLVNSRGTIVNMINNAVNEKGRMAII